MRLPSPNILPLTFLLMLLVLPAETPPPASAQTPSATAITDTAVHDLCNKSVALLGESPVHGFGKTLDVKAALVRRLVDDCHYNALFIESGTYDYLNLQRKLAAAQPITDADIAAAIGGLWSNQETHALIPFLRQKMQSGQLTLGGLDDQIGRGSWASHDMSAALVQHLQGEERPRCLAIFQRHMLYQYTDEAPYSPGDKAKIVGCLTDIGTRLAQPDEARKPWAAEDAMMVASLQRNFARNFTEDDFSKPGQSTQWMNDRDRSMYLNFHWLLARLPPHSKVIVWAATVHTAKEVSSIQGFEGRTPLGSYIHHDFGDRAFSLGFSALSGSWAAFGKEAHPLSAAPANSLEAKTFASTDADAVYLARDQLEKSGPSPARPLAPGFVTTNWGNVLDGLILFREEHPPAAIPF